MAAVATPKDVKENKAPLPRICIACCDGEDGPMQIELIKPCRSCNSDYCTGCLISMFFIAAMDQTRMPPKCCSLIQIHTVLRHLTDAQANHYRRKFEEWITPVKTYCPSPTCSAFISERLLPPSPPTVQSPISPSSPLPGKPSPESLKPVILEVLKNVTESQSARFFRGELPITELPGFNTVVQRPMDLGIIRSNIDTYRSMGDVTADMNLIVSNAVDYNGGQHPVTEAARELFYRYNVEVADAMDRLIQSPTARLPSSSPPFFPCPKCHVAICTRCRQIEHGEKPCDHSASDQEKAMLASFGYKRCPRCQAGVKKMYGCGHIQCHCGAHWCYYCEKSLNECDGACDGRGEDDSDEDNDDEDEYNSELDEMEQDHDTESSNIEKGQSDSATAPPSAQLSIDLASRIPTPVVSHQLANLDAGGGQRWAQSGYDFGDEPEEDTVFDVWCCTHRFEPFVAPLPDGFSRGDLDRMECNRCFDRVIVKKAPQPQPPKCTAQRKRSKITQGGRRVDVVMKDELVASNAHGPDEKEALECSRCRILVCPACRDKYKVKA